MSIKEKYEAIKHTIKLNGLDDVRYIVMDLDDDMITLNDEDGDELGNIGIAEIEKYLESLENN
jgi:hypothetical protein